MRILLTNLPTEGEARDYTTREYLLTDYTKYPPLGLLAIAADVDPRHSIEVLDVVVDGMLIEDTVQFIRNYNPDILGISAVTRRLYALHEISRRVRDLLPDTVIVCGGPHANYWPEETLSMRAMDYVLPGPGEKTFPLLVEALGNGKKEERLASIPNLHYRSANGKVLSNAPEQMPTILDSLPFPNRKLINLDNYYTAVDKSRMTTTYSSRGCPFRCIYCDVQEKSFCYRTAQSVVDEFEEIMALGIKEIHIFDDTFNVSMDRVKEICNEILERDLTIRWSARCRVVPFDREMMRLLKKAGCTRLHVGVESLDPATLKYMNKRQTPAEIETFFGLCREFDMETLGYFIIGFPTETQEYRKTLLQQVTDLGITYAFCNILFPLPKTQYYKSLLDNGTFKEDHWEKFVKNPTRDFESPLPRTTSEQKELEALADDFHRGFCLRPQFILREVRKSLGSPRMMLTKARLASRLLASTGSKK